MCSLTTVGIDEVSRLSLKQLPLRLEEHRSSSPSHLRLAPLPTPISFDLQQLEQATQTQLATDDCSHQLPLPAGRSA